MAGFTETATLRLVDATTPNLRKINAALTRLNTASRNLTTTINSLNTALNRLGSARLTNNLTRTTQALTSQISRLRTAQRSINAINTGLGTRARAATPRAAAPIPAAGGRMGAVGAGSVNIGGQNYIANVARTAIGAYAGFSFFNALRRAFQDGFREVTESAQRQSATFTYPGQQSANLFFAQSESQRLRGALSRSQILDVLSELGSGGLSQPDHADALRYAASRVNDFIIQTQTRLAIPFEEAATGMRDIIRVLEETGHLYDGQFDRYFNALTKISLVEGRFLPLNMLRSSVVFSRQAGQTMSSEGLANLAILTGMMGFTAGRSLNAVVRKFTGANTTQTALAEQQRLGLVTTHLEPIPGSRRSRNGSQRSRSIIDSVRGENRLAEDPVSWIREVAWPIIARDLGINADSDTDIRANIGRIARAMNRVTGEQLAASTMLQIVTGRRQLDAVRAASGAILGGRQSLEVLLRNALVGFQSAGNEVRTLLGTVTSALSVKLLPAINLVSAGFRSLNTWLIGNGDAEGIANRAGQIAKVALSGTLTTLYAIFSRFPVIMGAPQMKSAAVDLRLASAAIRSSSTTALRNQTSASIMQGAGASAAGAAGVRQSVSDSHLLALNALSQTARGNTNEEARIRAAAAREARRNRLILGAMAGGLALSTGLDIGSNIAASSNAPNWSRALGAAANITGMTLIGAQIGAAFGPWGAIIGGGAGLLISALYEAREPVYQAFQGLASLIQTVSQGLASGFVGMAKSLNLIPENGNIEEAGLYTWFTQSREQRLRGIGNYDRIQRENAMITSGAGRFDMIDQSKMHFTSEDLYRSIYGSPVPPNATQEDNLKNIGQQMAKGFQDAISPCGIQATVRQGNPFRYPSSSYNGRDYLSRS